MNKTIIINIGNSIIHIEEEAYEILMAYLNEIKQHFAKTADDFEIVKDIENRIAEMFAEILQKAQKQVIDVADVRSVIAQMGSVQDFLNEEEEEVKTENFYASYNGVKKLYRDTDEGVIAGVCAGLGHYLNVEARWLRLAFLLLTFLAGSSILVYLILWVVVPRAATRSERMEMKGEATNLYGYKKSFDEELAALKANMKSANDHLAPAMRKSGNLITQGVKMVGSLIKWIFKFFGKTIAICFIVFGFGMMIFLIVSLGMLVGFWDENTYQSFPLNVIDTSFRDGLIFNAFLTFFIPILALVLFALKVVNNRIEISKYVWFGLLIVWMIGAGTSAYYTAKIMGEFKDDAKLVQQVDLKPYQTYVIEVDKNMVFSKQDSIRYHLEETNMGRRMVVEDFDNGMFRNPRTVSFEVVKSHDGKSAVVATYESQGKNFETALKYAQNIEYKFLQRDSALIFNPAIRLKQHTAWRGQNVHLSLKIPVGARVLINKNNDRYWSFYYYWCREDDVDQTGAYREFIMTEEGLKCRYDLEHPEEKKSGQ
ncbi:PspC domain-containing protein [Pedobacter sp. SL55]|uniref:PspC domain-containing protein n=1 Tax=Pedobacter sp. SL55 TaxID=2995161 RepID=UPI0022705877|nr:PspC domain-containing protein [Pedobacter sp. SL55]WAC42346.1 PspC domain-containing protein [Pedobacter sp. SL55]